MRLWLIASLLAISTTCSAQDVPYYPRETKSNQDMGGINNNFSDIATTRTSRMTTTITPKSCPTGQALTGFQLHNGAIVGGACTAITSSSSSSSVIGQSTGTLHCLQYTATGQTTWYYPTSGSFNGNIFGYLIDGGCAGMGSNGSGNSGPGGGSGPITPFSINVTTNVIFNISSGTASNASITQVLSGNPSCFGYNIGTCIDTSTKLVKGSGCLGGSTAGNKTGGFGQSGGGGGACGNVACAGGAGGTCSDGGAGSGVGAVGGLSTALLKVFPMFGLSCGPGGPGSSANGQGGAGGGGISGQGFTGTGGDGGVTNNAGVGGTASTGAGGGGAGFSGVGLLNGGNGASGHGMACWYQ